MYIRNIKLQNNIFFGDIEFDFTDSNGNPYNNIVLAGENGCGKTQLLNLIYDFSNFSLDDNRRDEIRTFSIVLSEIELLQITQTLPSDNQLNSPTGVLSITQNFQTDPYTWDRFSLCYESKTDATNLTTVDFPADLIISNPKLKQLFKTIFSTVEINYTPNITTNVTSREIDEDITLSLRSGNDLGTEIQQLLIDIDTNDARELQKWVIENPKQEIPQSIIHKRISRFKNAFSKIFDNLNLSEVVNDEGTIKVLFKKNNNNINISALSSGEKQIVFRGAFLLQNQQSVKGTVALIDEPEISLHPIWQTKILDYYRSLFTENNHLQTSQIFVATHSQYVLRSALNHSNDTIIVLLNHTESTLETKRINAPLVLPNVTSAELNYVAFNVVSNDYHIELYGNLQNKIASIRRKNFCSVKECDTYIKQQPEYNRALHYKPSSFVNQNGRTTRYTTLSTFIRNAIDHPNSSSQFSEHELRTSIELLILLNKAIL